MERVLKPVASRRTQNHVDTLCMHERVHVCVYVAVTVTVTMPVAPLCTVLYVPYILNIKWNMYTLFLKTIPWHIILQQRMMAGQHKLWCHVFCFQQLTYKILTEVTMLK
jgi:hypothetical protein